MADHTSRPVAAPETVGHDGQLVRGRAAREGFEAAVDELDLVGGYIDIDIYTYIDMHMNIYIHRQSYTDVRVASDQSGS